MSFDASEFGRAVEQFGDDFLQAAAVGVSEFAEQVMADSKAICPVSPTDPKNPNYNGHPGALRDSGTVKPVVVDGESISVELGYNTTYAAAVHERPDLNHNYPGTGNPDGRWKYLQIPMILRGPQFLPYVLDRAREVLGG